MLKDFFCMKYSPFWKHDRRDEGSRVGYRCRCECLRDHTALKLTKSPANLQQTEHVSCSIVFHLVWSSLKTSDKWSLTNNLPNRQLLPEYLEEFLQSFQILEEGNEKKKTCGKIAETICKSTGCRMVTLYKNIPVLEGKTMFWCTMTNVPVHNMRIVK